MSFPIWKVPQSSGFQLRGFEPPGGLGFIVCFLLPQLKSFHRPGLVGRKKSIVPLL